MNGVFALVLGFANRPAFEKWYQEHRSGRIVIQGDETTYDKMKARQERDERGRKQEKRENSMTIN